MSVDLLGKNTIMLKKYLTLFLFILCHSCAPDMPEDGDFIKWTTTLDIPLINTDITLKTLADDSLVTVESISDFFQNGNVDDSIYVFNKNIKISSIEVGDKLTMDPITSSFSQNIDDISVENIEKNILSSVGTISLTDIEPANTDPFIFSEIYPEINDAPNDNMIAIPSFQILPIIKQFIFDDFDQVEFSEGILELSITNNMIIPLGAPLLIELLKVEMNDTVSIEGLTFQFEDVINANNGNALKMIDLANISLPGEILVRVSGNCQGTAGVEVLINEESKNSNFIVSISARDIKANSAIAKIPEQSIQENSFIELQPDSNKVVSALIKSGRLLIEINNYMNLSSSLNILIPSLKNPSGESFTTSIEINSNTIGITDTRDIEYYLLTLDPEDQTVLYSYDIMTNDSGDDFIEINSEDSIGVKIKIEGENQESGLTFSEFTGYLNQDAMIDSNTINIETATKVDEAILNSGKLELSILNEIGINAVVNFSINEITKDGNYLDTSFTISNQPMDIMIDLKNYNLNLNLDSNPQFLTYTSSIDIPTENLISLAFDNSISIDVYLDSISFSQVSGYIDPVDVIIDSIQKNIDLPNQLENLDFSTIKMDFSFNSNLNLPIHLDLELLSSNDVTGEIFSKTINTVNITETPEFSVQGLEELINIKPNKIIAFGSAKIGSIDDFGSISISDSLNGSINILAPFSFEIKEDSNIKLEHEKLDAINIDDLVKAKVFVDYENNLDLGANIIVLTATDTTLFENFMADTLLEFTLEPSKASKDSIILDKSSLELLSKDNNYIESNFKLLSLDDEPSRFLSTDTIKCSIYLNTEILLDLNSEE